MAEKKYASLESLQTFLDNLKTKFATSTHKHTMSDISDYTVDTALSSTSTNPVQNKVLDAEFDAISDGMGALESAIDNKAETTLSNVDNATFKSKATSAGVTEGLATETYVDNKVASMVDSAPETLNTLNELAAALGDDPNFATTIATQIGQKTDRLTAYMFDSSVDGRCNITIDGYTGYTNGDMIQVIITNTVQGDTLSLNINNLGDVQIYRPCSDGSYTNQFYGVHKLDDGHMYTFVYFTGAFYCLQLTKPYGEDDFVKPVAITSGGTGAKNAIDALKNLGITATATELNKMDGVTATTTELNYVAGAKSNIQTQLDNLDSALDSKAPTSHSHNIADMDDYSSVIGGIYGDIGGMWSTFDSKADVNHTHSVSDIDDIDDLVLITVADIDNICGTNVLVQSAEEVSF